jgi:hypothetical protein
MKKIVLTLLTLVALTAQAFAAHGNCPGCAGRHGRGGEEKKLKLPGKLGDVHADKAFNKASKARDRAAKRAARG